MTVSYANIITIQDSASKLLCKLERFKQDRLLCYHFFKRDFGQIISWLKFKNIYMYISIPNKIPLVNIFFSDYPQNILGLQWQPVLVKNFILLSHWKTHSSLIPSLLPTHIQLTTKKVLQFLLLSLTLTVVPNSSSYHHSPEIVTISLLSVSYTFNPHMLFIFLNHLCINVCFLS